jgi:hypothetical protein
VFYVKVRDAFVLLQGKSCKIFVSTRTRLNIARGKGKIVNVPTDVSCRKVFYGEINALKIMY